MNPPDWGWAKILVQRLYPYDVRKLTCAEFLDAYWNKVTKLQLFDMHKLDEHALAIARDKHADILI